VRDIVATGNFTHWLPETVAALDGLALLMLSQLGFAPLTPRSLARVRPSAVRARINSFSNSASPPNTVSIRQEFAASERSGLRGRPDFLQGGLMSL